MIDILEKSMIFQSDLNGGYFDDDYFFYDFSRTLRYFNLRPEQLVEILRSGYRSKYVVIFEASILFNVKNSVICSNIELYSKIELN